MNVVAVWERIRETKPQTKTSCIRVGCLKCYGKFSEKKKVLLLRTRLFYDIFFYKSFELSFTFWFDWSPFNDAYSQKFSEKSKEKKSKINLPKATLASWILHKQRKSILTSFILLGITPSSYKFCMQVN